MKAILTIALILTFLGAFDLVLYSMFNADFITPIFGSERTVGSDFLMILIGISSLLILFWGLKEIYSGKKQLIVEAPRETA